MMQKVDPQAKKGARIKIKESSIKVTTRTKTQEKLDLQIF
jgi:hypothetical protein